MTSAAFILLSCGLTFGVPLLLAIRELWFLRLKSSGGDGPPPPQALPLVPKPLPDCLLPRPVTKRDRQFIYDLENV